MPIATSSQTIGPYWHLLEEKEWADLTRFGADGPKMRLIGSLTEGDGLPVTDACIELWQTDPPADETFTGFGRCATDADGNYHFVTVKPGPVSGRGLLLAASFLSLSDLPVGIAIGVYTLIVLLRPFAAAEPTSDREIRRDIS